MGCDIHSVFQARKGDEWVDVATFWDDERHYQLFSVLADVRNGYGFAGVQTGEWVKPISSPRGLPEDFAYECYEHPMSDPDALVPRRRGWWFEDHPLEVKSMAPDTMMVLSGYRYEDEPITLFDCALWMGEHSFSWLTGEELLNWYENAPTVVKIGVVSREYFDKWDKVSPPEWYCQDVLGGRTRILNEAAVGKTPPKLGDYQFDWTHVRVTWERSLKDELAYFFKEVQRLVDKHGKIRFVFGFDS